MAAPFGCPGAAWSGNPVTKQQGDPVRRDGVRRLCPTTRPALPKISTRHLVHRLVGQPVCERLTDVFPDSFAERLDKEFGNKVVGVGQLVRGLAQLFLRYQPFRSTLAEVRC